MTDYLLLAIMAVVTIGLLVLRTNTAVGYLALCAGSVLLLSSGDNAGLVASSLTSGMSAAAMIAKLILLFAPLVVCAVLLRGQVHKLMVVFSFVPAACIAFLGMVLAVPLLPEATRMTVQSTEVWQLLVQYQEAFTGIGLVASICMIALTIRPKHDKHGKKRH